MLRACVITQFLFILLLNLAALHVHQGMAVGCHEVEREALLKFKRSLNDQSNRLSSWKGRRCCDWDGVGCDNVTAFVNRLELPDPYHFQFVDYVTTHPLSITTTSNRSAVYPALPSGFYLPKRNSSQSKLDPCLLELKHLNYLNLSHNDFQGSQIPKFIGSFKYLRYLDLSHSNFSGVVPSQFGNLTRLQTLDLSYNDLSSDLQWVSKLVSLKYLDFSGSHIFQTNNTMHALNMPPSLRVLYLDQCQNLENNPLLLHRLFSNSTWLFGIQHLDLSGNSLGGTLPYVLANMTSIRYLDLSDNELNSPIPLWLENMASLTYLDLSDNIFTGAIPLRLGNMTSLSHLDLSDNKLNGSIPLSMRSMRKLEYLDLSSNSFSSVEGGSIMGILGDLCKLVAIDLSANSIVGKIEANHKNFSKCVTYDLEYLRLGGNMIGGMLRSWLGDFKNLTLLDISSNSINGPIPKSIGRLSYLEYLDLSFNTLNGTIPQGLGECKSLVHIDLSSNFLHGAVSESHLDNLSRLVYLDLSYNVMEWNISSNWSPPFQLSGLHMASCKIQSQFPQWIGEQTKLQVLELSVNNMSAELPKCFSSNQLTYINISHNQITGRVPYIYSSKLEFLDLSFNLLSGSLVHPDPFAEDDTVGTQICQLYSLGLLNLQMNNISGGIPDCWGGLNRLAYINLASNGLSGIIPLSLGLLSKLAFLKLSNNSLHGPIPTTLSTNTSLQILDLGDNKLVGNIPSNWGENSLQLLRLRGNQFIGSIPPTLCDIGTLQIIDLSLNNLTGGIPRCFSHLLQMESSSNVDGLVNPFLELGDDSTMVVLKGAELHYTTTLEYVVNIDLSSNALTGTIPEEITNLSALIGLNLSHNHLTGNIPNKIGEMTSLESLDLSNNNLSGTIPSSLSVLTSLSFLNLSYNKLHGQIPTGRQLQTLNDPSIYEGNPGLCGNPLPNNCRTKHGENQPIQGKEKSDVWEKPLLYLVIMSGFATGFWGVVGSLLLKTRFRFAFFQVVGNVADYLYVQVMIRLNRLRN